MKETFVPIQGFEGEYEINKDGIIRTVERVKKLSSGRSHPIKSKIKTQLRAKNGYKCVVLSKNNKSNGQYVHRLLALSFIPNPLKLKCINHKNGIKTDNRIENLEWCDHSKNNIHALDNKLRKTRGKMKIADITKIKELKNAGFTNERIAMKTGFSECIVQGITSNTTYQKYVNF